MTFLFHFGLMIIYLVLIVFACTLFTNSIEFLGNKLKLGNNATGSILAVVGTGLPEAIVPIVAVFGVYFSGMKIEAAQNIAIGAVLGSPFMLSTFAFFLLSICLIFKKRNFLLFDYKTAIREYKYFLIAYVLAAIFLLNPLKEFKIVAIALLVLLYAVFVYRTIIKSRSACVECECCELYFAKWLKFEKIALLFQLMLSLFLLVIAAYYFVVEIKYFSILLNVSPAIISLLVTPFATELPECINSLIWLKQDKDDLAMANIIGAIVFQSTIVFAIAIALTTWCIGELLLINYILTFVIATIFVISMLMSKKITLSNLMFCGIIYFAYLLIVLFK